jgi:hypothetical protein
MRLDRNLLIGAASALAISALPLNLESAALGSFQLSAAYAKGGNGGGHGGGHGHGGSGSHGKSADAGSHGKSGSVRSGSRHVDKLLGSTFAKETRAERKRAHDDVKMAKAEAKSLRAQQMAALPDTALIPETKPEEKNLHARLAGLNSLKRNYHAYLNSQSPRFAGIFDYVRDSAEGVLDPDDEALRQALLDAANENRVAQYGDDYINDDVMDWAKDVLGVGGAVGKIDEVRESLEDSQETLQIDSQ